MSETIENVNGAKKMIHPQELEDRKHTEYENNLWWEMDKIAVKYSNPVPTDTAEERLKKAVAAELMMSFLEKPTHEWCQEKYKKEHG